MSTHSAECIPHEPSPGELVQRTLIRKTSLLRKIEPIARRSGFANRIIYNPHLLQTLVRKSRERRNDPEIVKDAHRISMRPNSDRSPLYDVRKHAVHVRLNDACELMSRGRCRLRVNQQPVFALASFAGHASVFLRGCATRSLKAKRGGARRDRTDDLMLAKHALSQLSYGPVTRRRMPQA